MPIIPPYFQKVMPAISRADQAPSITTLPIHRHRFTAPKVRIHLNDLQHEGTSIFLSNTKGNEDIETQIQNVLNLLYTKDDHLPSTRSITFVLRQMDGVAYTTGIDLDDDHKEIHINLGYIRRIKSHTRDEILGFVCHELVHCFQWNAHNTCPGGLIEGIADWVRLRAGLAAKHWTEEADGCWDDGYQHTGYFLDYLERRFGSGTVRKINAWMRKQKYDEEKLFEDCCKGHQVADLWKAYQEDLKERKGGDDSMKVDPPAPIATHAVQQGRRSQEGDQTEWI